MKPYQLIGPDGYATVEKPWGKEVWFALAPGYIGKIISIHPAKATSYHFHKEKDETIYVLSGELRVTIGKSRAIPFKDAIDEIVQEGCAVRIQPGTPHMLSSWCHEPLVLLEVSLPFTDDSVRLEDPCNKRACIGDEISEN